MLHIGWHKASFLKVIVVFQVFELGTGATQTVEGRQEARGVLGGRPDVGFLRSLKAWSLLVIVGGGIDPHSTSFGKAAFSQGRGHAVILHAYGGVDTEE